MPTPHCWRCSTLVEEGLVKLEEGGEAEGSPTQATRTTSQRRVDGASR